MFARAYQIASHYTQPVLISLLRFDGTVECSIGTFVIVNAEGWITTAAHIFDVMLAGQKDTVEIERYYQEINEINHNTFLSPAEKKKRLANVRSNPKWIKKTSYWWGADGFGIDQINLYKENDLAIGILTNYNPQFSALYPVFKQPENLAFGTSLCKLGYPFHEVKATFNEAANSFQIAPDTMPIPRFPIDGIFTREVISASQTGSSFDIKFIETSTPGLRGQSGGPVFDKDGNIWGIQSRTAHLALGFSPGVKFHNKDVIEHQFLNVGMAVHVETILRVFKEKGVDFQLSER